MHRSAPLLFRSLIYALRGGFLVRPLVIALLLGGTGAVLSSVEETVPQLGDWLPQTLFPSRQDPQMVQVIFAGIAGSIMTVVSIVFAILLMTLTLAPVMGLAICVSSTPGTCCISRAVTASAYACSAVSAISSRPASHCSLFRGPIV